MPKVVAPLHLRSGVEAIQANVMKWIHCAVRRTINVDINAFAGNGLAIMFGDQQRAGRNTSLVETWFGALDQGQITTLRNNLALMETVLAHPQTSIRIVDAPMIFGDREYYAQVRGRYNHSNPKLSVEVADQWVPANLDTKVNTLFHELSHRILGTLDLGPRQGYREMMYGIENAQHLADNAPDDALRNAENYGYYIALCNDLVNQAP